MRNNKVYVSFIFVGALIGERVLHNTTGALWEMNNKGVSFFMCDVPSVFLMETYGTDYSFEETL